MIASSSAIAPHCIVARIIWSTEANARALRLLHDHAEVRRRRGDGAEELRRPVSSYDSVRRSGARAKSCTILQAGEVGMLHVDRRLAVDEHAAVAVDDERGHVAFAFLADALDDAAQADQADDGADDVSVRRAPARPSRSPG